MARRWEPGPVFATELQAAARRWQTYATRAAFVAALLAAFGCVWWLNGSSRTAGRLANMAAAGERFYFALVGTQLALLLLAAPAATAGAVCLDKTRGSLLHLLVTDLSVAEIVLGKLFARLAPVFGLLLAGLPVLAIATLAGGIEPRTVFGAFLVSAGVAVVGCALALVFSVWAGKVLDVLLTVYGLEILGLLALPGWTFIGRILWGGWGWPAPPVWLQKSNPFWLAFAPYSRPGATGPADPLLFFAGAVALSGALALVAVVSVRRAALGVRGVPSRHGRQRIRWQATWLPGPSLDRNPVLWREWHRRQPSRGLRAARSIFLVAASGLTAVVVFNVANGNSLSIRAAGIINGLIVSLGLLLFCVSAATSLSEERIRGGLDVLLTTPLSTGSIIRGKWWGIYRAVPALVVLPALNLAATMYFTEGPTFWSSGPAPQAWRLTGIYRWQYGLLALGLTLAYGAALTSLGLALATWVSRPGQAVAWCVTAFVLVTVVPAVLGVWLSRHRGSPNTAWLGMASPFWGPAVATEIISLPSEDLFLRTFLRSAKVWIGVYFGIAVVLQLATRLTFERCFGRVRQAVPWRVLGRARV